MHADLRTGAGRAEAGAAPGRLRRDAGRGAESFEPHRLAAYLYGLAQTFSDFYENCPVLKAPTDAVRENRAALVKLTGETLKAGLGLLGISAPDQL